ncbi:MAG: hypothetical protein RBS49_10080 [Sphaerochaeta sp.]|jgi:hypothetical protein|nr:hypothetical protein [Sphaerochaeta sp.]MDX9916216.1 hypothetical protein [Sphaerochaeta sp.]
MDTMSDRSEGERARAERALAAFKEAQEAFIGVAAEVGIEDEEDVVTLVKQVRSKQA